MNKIASMKYQSSLLYPFPTSPEYNIPTIFPSPFNNPPHPVARAASQDLQKRLLAEDKFSRDFYSAGNGKMFAVLVVRCAEGEHYYLSAFAGALEGEWQIPGFVPPVFDETERQLFLPTANDELLRLQDKIVSLMASSQLISLVNNLDAFKKLHQEELLELKTRHRQNRSVRHQKREILEIEYKDNDDQSFIDNQLVKLSFASQQDKLELRDFNRRWEQVLNNAQTALDDFNQQSENLKKQHEKKSRQLQKKLFDGYRLINVLGEEQRMRFFFDDNTPPVEAGDCASVKLIHYAVKNKLNPIAMAEFWWGAEPDKSIRHHKHFYPACRGKCRPILPFMLKGLEVEPPPVYGADFSDHHAPVIVYEDDNLVVVNKPAGLLSVPGKRVEDSVQTRMQARYPHASGPLLVHRLDLATSGLLLVAKNLETHKALQRQFIKRVIEKRYVALLSNEVAADSGVLELPLRVDFDDRPRQLVCFEHGKWAKTEWNVLAREPGRTRVQFHPITGRTHQLRIHAAHKSGLNAPIVGDRLYGVANDRLYLHAEWLRFINPTTGRTIEVTAPVPF